MRKLGFWVLAASAACSSESTATLDLTTGGEGDALTRQPAPTTLVVAEIGTDGTSKELSRTALPADTIGLGDVGKNDTGAIRVTAIDGAGKVLLRGDTLLFEFGALADATLEVFVQRTGELARMPRAPSIVLDQPIVDVLVGRYIIAASGTSTLLYDLLFLQPQGAVPVLPRTAASLATYGTIAIAIDGNGATTLDLSDASTTEQPAPVGGTWADVAGGATVYASDGSSYIVGGTRIGGGATTRVVHIGADGTLTFVNLVTAREGACATWIEGRGVVVYGGAAQGSGAELLAPGAAQAAALPYPSDPVRSCGVAPLDASHVVVAGGTTTPGSPTAPAAARALDLGCASGCTPVAWAGTVTLPRAQAVGLAADAALLAGDDDGGQTHVYRISVGELHEVPLKSPRKGARLVALPNGASGIVGGAADIETYRD